MRTGFTTDFASIPRAVRWLFDTAGGNSEPGVFHDALWRESKRTDAPRRVDPWDADGLFRRALRESGATALTRALMWIAVRATATLSGRFGEQGPPAPVKVGQVVGMAAVGAASVGVPTLVAVVGRVLYWALEWAVAVPWFLFERARRTQTNLPWHPFRKRHVEEKSPKELLLIFERDSAAGRKLETMLSPQNDRVVDDAELDRLPPGAFANAY